MPKKNTKKNTKKNKKGGTTANQKGVAAQLRDYVTERKDFTLRNNLLNSGDNKLLSFIIHSGDQNPSVKVKKKTKQNPFADKKNRYSHTAQNILHKIGLRVIVENPDEWVHIANEEPYPPEAQEWYISPGTAPFGDSSSSDAAVAASAAASSSPKSSSKSSSKSKSKSKSKK